MKTKKTHLKIVSIETEDQAKEERRNKRKAVTEERDNESDGLSIDRDERRAVLAEFIDRIDQHFSETAFQFAGGLADNSLNFSEGEELPDFFNRLHPWTKPYRARIKALLQTHNVQGDPLTQDLDNELDVLEWTYQETSFKLGILAGARLAGCSPQKVRKMAEFLVGNLR